MRIPYTIYQIYQIQIIANENISSSSWEITNNTTNSAFRCKSDSRSQVFEVHSSICMYPFCCAFSYVSSGHLDKMIHDYTDCISLTYLHHVFSHICAKEEVKRPEGLQLEVWPLSLLHTSFAL